jgi:hypothetical protein
LVSQSQWSRRSQQLRWGGENRGSRKDLLGRANELLWGSKRGTEESRSTTCDEAWAESSAWSADWTSEQCGEVWCDNRSLWNSDWGTEQDSLTETWIDVEQCHLSFSLNFKIGDVPVINTFQKSNLPPS